MDQKGDELIQSVTSEAEMAIQRIEETAQSCNDILNRQLQVAVDTIQGAVDMMQEWLRQAQVSQERTIHEAITELQRAVADQLQRNSDAVEMAGTRAIALLERKGDELIKSTEMRAEIMAQRMDEIPKRWKETLADHKNTVLEVIPDMARSSQPEQAPSWAQGMEAWMTRFDTRFSSEVMAIKDVLTVQSQTLNAYAQV
ncbi:hypothetical protein EC991_010211 [Linnemannia zychae]|nr:hypothetical protein EC991_010211 [Linnemannia zychae]